MSDNGKRKFCVHENQMLTFSRNHQQLFSDNHYKLSPQTQPYLELIVSRLLQTVSVGENNK